jgi:ABC-type branched-subunit amino acid transport system substrate-binding protein
MLAPLSGDNAARGQALVNAAKLALGDPPPIVLDVHDTGGTPAGAAAAAQAAISGGAMLIIGPLTSGETAAVAGPARAASIPVLAFTNDPSRAQPGVWTLGITPVQQAHRLVGAVTAEGKTRFAAVLPETGFGQAMATALTQAVQAANLPAPDIRTYSGGMSAANSVMRDISGYASRRGPIDAQIKAARERHDAEGRKQAAELARSAIPPAPFDALLLADTGDKLVQLTSLLPYYDLDSVRVLGPALWAEPAARGGARIGGAWFAAPDPAARSGFDAKYMAAYGSPAPGLADFAYDAAAIARVLAQSGDFSTAALSRPEGYAGVDGVLGLLPDGNVRRGLALFEIKGGAPVMIEPAPENLAGPGI